MRSYVAWLWKVFAKVFRPINFRHHHYVIIIVLWNIRIGTDWAFSTDAFFENLITLSFYLQTRAKITDGFFYLISLLFHLQTRVENTGFFSNYMNLFHQCLCILYVSSPIKKPNADFILSNCNTKIIHGNNKKNICCDKITKSNTDIFLSNFNTQIIHGNNEVTSVVIK